MCLFFMVMNEPHRNKNKIIKDISICPCKINTELWNKKKNIIQTIKKTLIPVYLNKIDCLILEKASWWLSNLFMCLKNVF